MRNFKVGDRVRIVKPGYTGVTMGDIGVAIECNGRVDTKLDWATFPTSKTLSQFSFFDGELELVKEETKPMTKTLFKAVHIDNPEDLHTTYSSIYAGQPCDIGFGKREKLTYKIGKITIAPINSEGIFCYQKLTKAKKHADKGQDHDQMKVMEPCAVLEVEPIELSGQVIIDEVKPDAVRVIREVWRETIEPPRPAPKEEWVDVTADHNYKIEFGLDNTVKVLHLETR